MNFEGKMLVSFLVVYVLFAQVISWNENSKVDLFKAIIDEDRLEIDTFANNTGDRSYYGGHYYSDKAPGVSFLSTGVYTVWKTVCGSIHVCASPSDKTASAADKIMQLNNSYTKIFNLADLGAIFTGSLFFSIVAMSAIPTALTALLVYRLSKLLLEKEAHRRALAITYGIGTLAFAYGTVFFTHAMAAFLVFLSFYIMFKLKTEMHECKRGKTRFSSFTPVAVAGALVGFAAVVDYPTGLISVLLLAYTLTFKDRRTTALFAALMVVGAMPLAIYNLSILGTPFKFVYSFTDPAIRTDTNVNMGFSNLPSPFIMYRQTFDSYRGLFFFSPVLLLSVAGLYWMTKEHRTEALLVIAAFLGMMIAFSMRSVDFFDFGASFGAREYLPVVPFLMLPLASYLKNSSFTIFKVLLIASIFINVIGLQNWEWLVGGANNVYIAEPYRSEVNSFKMLANPLKDFYFPLFLKNGPRARIVENLIDGIDVFDVRHAFSTENKHPFVTVLPLIVIMALIWHENIGIKRILEALKDNPELAFVPAILYLLLI